MLNDIELVKRGDLSVPVNATQNDSNMTIIEDSVNTTHSRLGNSRYR